MSKLAFVLVVLLFGSSAFADSDNRESSKYAKYALNKQHSYDDESYSGKRDKKHGRRRGHGNSPVCDDLRGGTRGLHGLCVSYCETQNVSEDFKPHHFKPHKAKRKAAKREKVLARYNAKKGASDPEMPCVEQASPTVTICPCWAPAELDADKWRGKSPAAACRNTLTSDELSAGTTGLDFGRALALTTIAYAGTDQEEVMNFCVREDNATSVKMSEKILDPKVVAACRAQVKATCDALAG